MIQFSIPTALSVFAATSAVAVTSVAVALPSLQSEPVSTPVASPSISSTPTPTGTQVLGTGGDSPLKAFGNHDVGNGIMLQDLPLGLAASVRASGVTFSYVGACAGSGPGSGASITVWGNSGQKKSWGGAGYCNGGFTFATTSMVWSEDTRNSYCYSPLGGSSAYRAEVNGQFSEWVSIPAEYMQCINGQAPEGPPPPGNEIPQSSSTPLTPAPEPSNSVSSSPDPQIPAP